VKGAIGLGNSDLFCKWRFESSAPDSWRVVHGDTTGHSWIAERKSTSDMALWNHPFSITFAPTSIRGWPKICVDVFETDKHNRVDLGGYGWCSVPMSAGTYEREIPLSRPKADSFVELATALLGGKPQLTDPGSLQTATSKFGHNTVSTGVVVVELVVILKGFGPQVEFATSPVASSSAKPAAATPALAKES